MLRFPAEELNNVLADEKLSINRHKKIEQGYLVNHKINNYRVG